jgi:dihydropteroate synthase
VAELGVPYVLMHMRGDLASMQQSINTAYGNTWLEVGGELQHAADRAMMAGIPAWNIILDPGR